MIPLKLEKVSFEYVSGKPILKDFSAEFQAGKLCAIVGKSGSGKTTLLSILAGLNQPQEGNVYVNDSLQSYRKLSGLRRSKIGVVFQQFNLLPHLSAVENIELSMRVAGVNTKNKREIAIKLLEQVGIDELKARSRILKLSGGEQQRVAIARALSINPDIILADEPTGNLDKTNLDIIMNIFKDLAHNQGKCIVIVTHSDTVSKSCDKILKL